MHTLNKELEEKVVALVKEKKVPEAVALVMKELRLGMREAKDIVDKYRS